jgi:hypothetical protein
MNEHFKSVSVMLYREILERGDPLEIKVGGSSMWPFVRDGETLILRKTALNDFGKGDIIATYADQRLICHRVFRKGKDFIQTKADALPGLDAKISFGDVLGKVVARRRNEHFYKCDDRLSTLKGKCILWFSFFWAPLIPALRRFKVLFVR